MRKRHRIGRAAIAPVLAILTACSGGASSHDAGVPAVPSARSAPSAGARHATARFSIAIPRRKRHHGRQPGYVSPGTKSMSISIVPNGSGVALKKDLNLTSSSPGCSIVSGSVLCTLSFAIVPGNYLATIDTYDALDEGGNVLSRGESLPLKIVADAANDVPLVLGGVPHALSVTPGATIITGTQAGGFTVGGVAPLIVNATDADGDTIVGAGTPYTGSVVNGNGWNVASAPSPAAPDQLQVTPGASGSQATLKIAVAYDAATCALPGVVCSITFGATSQPVQYLFVADCEQTCHNGSSTPDAVDVYTAPYTGAPIATITQGMHNPVSVAVDASGRLFVANCSQCFGSGTDSVTVYSPPYSNSSAPTATLTTGIFHPEKLALNSAGDVFVWNCFQGCRYAGDDTITRYTGTLTDASTPATTITPTQPFYIGGFAIDSTDTLLLLGCQQLGCYQGDTDPASVLAYATPYSGTAAVTTNGIADPYGLGVDQKGHMFVGSLESPTACASPPCYEVSVYSAPYTSNTAIATIQNGVSAPRTVTGDAAGNIYVVNGYGTTPVTEYPSSFSDASPTQLFAPSNYNGGSIALDQAGDIFLANDTSVQLGTTPYSTLTPIATTLTLPAAIAIGP